MLYLDSSIIVRYDEETERNCGPFDDVYIGYSIQSIWAVSMVAVAIGYDLLPLDQLYMRTTYTIDGFNLYVYW